MAIYAMPLGSAIKLQVRAAKKQPGLREAFYADTAVDVRPALVSYADGATTLKLLGSGVRAGLCCDALDL